MTARYNGSEVSDKIYRACVIYCAYHELDPLEVVITECPVSLSPESMIGGAWIANADLVTPKQVKRYRWETYISKIAEFTAIHEACVASGLLCVRSTKPDFVVAVCDWTEIVTIRIIIYLLALCFADVYFVMYPSITAVLLSPFMFAALVRAALYSERKSKKR